MKKKLLSVICFLACVISVQPQTLYGLTPYGGNDGWGALIKFIPATNNLTVAKSFEGFVQTPLYTNFIQAADGKFYGMTHSGGNHKTNGWLGEGGGAIFSYDPSSSTYTRLKDFDGIDGANPHGSLIQASDGKLYGMTFQGGSGYNGASSGNGVIFSFDPSTSTYTKLKDFDGINGANPHGSLIQASDGKLYGMTSQGGSNDLGVIFSLETSTSTYTKLKDFDGINGAYPYGSLMQASDGKFYGMAGGVIFSFDPSTSIYTKLKDFDFISGANPYGSLIQASDGKLYGMTPNGGSNDRGVIFSFDPSTSTYTKLRDFGYINGGKPYGSLVQASNGKLYGMTFQGGSGTNGAGYGVIFSFDPSTSTYTKLKDFDGANGSNPYGSLMQASDGKLYGMTFVGGTNAYGVIFSFDPSTSDYSKLKDFEATNGRNPSASMIRASNGKLYGMTPNGGSVNNSPNVFGSNGIIFSYDPSTSIYTKLMDFDGANGAHPFGSLMQASDGKLYGMTAEGGNVAPYPYRGYGVIFSFDPSTSTYTKLMDFDGANAGNPFGSLMQASDGKLYGMTSLGVNSVGLSQGIIFSFDPSNSSFTKLKAFDITDGSEPHGSLIQASNGKLYGMAWGGSNGFGVIFSFDPSTSIYTKLKDFGGADGGSPYSSLIQATDGKLYGMTPEGGGSGYGVIFSFDPSTSIYTKLMDFGGADGGNPYGNLMQATDGKLYGMTSNSTSGGGYNFQGVIFSFDPSTSTYTKLQDFNITNGAYPGFNSAFIEVSTTALPVTFLSFDGKLINNQVVLSWSTADEINNKGFDIERSKNGRDFFKIGLIEAKGNLSSISYYTFTDINFTSAVNFYRLKQIDMDGKFKYSRIIKINAQNANAPQIVIAPNPVFNSTSVSFTIPQPQHVSLKIFDVNGKLIKILADKKLEKGQYDFQWNTSVIQAGMYFLKIDAGAYSDTKKLSVIK